MSHEINYKEHIYNGEVAPVLRNQTDEDRQSNDGAPWHRREDEPERAYNAFLIYLDMGSSRSYKGLADVLYSNEESITRIETWARNFSWQRRVEAWDKFVSETRVSQMEKAVVESEQLALRYLPKITHEMIMIASGQKDGSRHQVSAMKDYMDRFGPAKQQSQKGVEINNYEVNYPELPESARSPLENVEEADFEEISEHAQQLIPESLKSKRR